MNGDSVSSRKGTFTVKITSILNNLGLFHDTNDVLFNSGTIFSSVTLFNKLID